MKKRADKIKDLLDNLNASFEKNRNDCRKSVLSTLEEIMSLREDIQDQRLKRPERRLREALKQIDDLADIFQTAFVKLEEETEKLHHDLDYSRIGMALSTLTETYKPTLNNFSDSLLDGLIAAAGAERGFILFYIPESTEADIIAARNYITKNLALEEYTFSRTLLNEVFQIGKPLLIDDAFNHDVYSTAASVKRYEIKSVAAAPIKQNGRIVGALYLENNNIPKAFDEEDLRLLEKAAKFAVFYLNNARLLPIITEADNHTHLDAKKASREIVGDSPKMLELLEEIRQISKHEVINRTEDSPATILITGESGTGKELAARAIHFQGPRREHPFVAINCAAIPKELLESELFGHEKGAYTDASDRHVGQIEQANGGTVFLDEISELAYPLQAKLLRFLQSREFHRLGGKHSIRVDVRVVAATSKDLKVMAEEGEFQKALYYRLEVIPVEMPPLRERKEDIPLLIDHFVGKFSSAYGKRVRIEEEVYEALKEYQFPGNVRELENLIHRLAVFASDESIRIGDLPGKILETRARRINLAKDPLHTILHTAPADAEDLKERKQEIKRLLAEQELMLAEKVLEEEKGNITKAADRLGMHRITLHNLVKGKKK